MTLSECTNYLLLQVERDVAARFEKRFQAVSVAKGDVLQDPGAPLQFVYFPETAVLAAGAETLAGEIVHVDLIGAEGVFGAFEACGSRQCFARLAVLMPGLVLRLAAPAYREMFDASPALRTAVHKHAELLIVEARHFVACNALHTVENRICRALLDVADRNPDSRASPLRRMRLLKSLASSARLWPRPWLRCSARGSSKQAAARSSC